MLTLLHMRYVEIRWDTYGCADTQISRLFTWLCASSRWLLYQVSPSGQSVQNTCDITGWPCRFVYIFTLYIFKMGRFQIRNLLHLRAFSYPKIAVKEHSKHLIDQTGPNFVGRASKVQKLGFASTFGDSKFIYLLPAILFCANIWELRTEIFFCARQKN